MSILNLNQELAVLEVTGADATTYLQGQLTNDIRELPAKQYQLSAHLNNKGRILATFIITSPASDFYYLITPRNVISKILPRLKMFVLRSKVVISESKQQICLSDKALGAGVNIELNNQYLTITEQLPEVSISDSTLWHKFAVETTLPLIYENSQEKIIPQQINWELLGGVNFKKGCYTGQEIVARTHYLGKVKRRLVKFTTDGIPAIGQTIVSPELDNQEIGFVVDFYQAESQYIGLASLQLDYINSAYLDHANNYQLNCNIISQE